MLMSQHILNDSVIAVVQCFGSSEENISNYSVFTFE